MRSVAYQTDKFDKDVVLDKVFGYLVEQGLENVTIRELCKCCEIVQGSLYYWFGDKNTVISEATEHGLKKVTEKLFAYAFKTVSDLPEFFAGCLNEIDKYRRELRFVYQFAASPVYGNLIRANGHGFRDIYDKYAEKLAVLLECDANRLQVIVYLFISAVLDYVIWEDRDSSQMQLDFILSTLPTIINSKKIKEINSTEVRKV